MDNQNEIEKLYRAEQQKYTYYIIGLCVACIGFSVVHTMGQQLKLTQIPLGLAILSWSISIYYGFKFLQSGMGVLYNNFYMLEIEKGYDEEIGNNPEYIISAKKGIFEATKSIAIKAERYFTRLIKMFFGGIIFFIAWHITEMYFNIK